MTTNVFERTHTAFPQMWCSQNVPESKQMERESVFTDRFDRRHLTEVVNFVMQIFRSKGQETGFAPSLRSRSMSHAQAGQPQARNV